LDVEISENVEMWKIPTSTSNMIDGSTGVVKGSVWERGV